jgi:ABC-2 type transport system ATP-binding protein
MLTGYFLPSSGDIRVKEYSVYDDLLNIKKLIGYLPESAPLYQGMLVYDYLDYIANIRQLDIEEKLGRIRKLVDICGLQGIMHSPIGELSKGLKQRVGLAHAMMNDPEILILDEPTSGLDPNQIAEIREIIREIGKEKTVILSTHILSEAEATCDRIVIINKGKIIADGSTQMLKQSSSKQRAIHLSLLKADSPAVRDRLSQVSGVSVVDTQEDEAEQALHVKLTCNANADLRESIYHTIKETDWVILEFYQETQTLENIFRELTREN